MTVEEVWHKNILFICFGFFFSVITTNFFPIGEQNIYCSKSVFLSFQDFASVAHYIVYALLSATLALFHEETVGNTEVSAGFLVF